jgi:DNA repair exonuclease SbcCD ATPase subunit
MAQLPWAEIIADVSEALGRELDSLVELARRTASFQASRETDAVRLSLVIRTARTGAVAAGGGTPALARAGALADALATIRAERADEEALAGRAAETEKALREAEARLDQMRVRLAELEAAAARDGAPALEDARRAIDGLRSDLAAERIARAAAEAGLAMLEREHEALRASLQEAVAARDEALTLLEDSRRLADDLRSEVVELWRVLRETHPGDPLSISIRADFESRRDGVERVQAKVLDARELFRRRSHRWPIAV